jgi:hypothetical protein
MTSTAPTISTQYAFHPLAVVFPLMAGGEYAELIRDIREYGLNEPIAVYEDKILDGRNRYRACLEAGVEPHFTTFKGDDPIAFVISQNIRRRHLTAEQKRELIANLIKATPEKSDRQIAETVRTSHHTVGDVRAKMESRGQVAHVETRTDSKGRQQPARKPRNYLRVKILRASKLGDDVMAKIKGTAAPTFRFGE